MLYHMYYRNMLGVSMRYCHNQQEAEDIVQEGFYTIFSKFRQFKETGPLEAWMRRIMVNTAIDHYRKNGKTTHVEIQEGKSESDGLSVDFPENMTAEKILEVMRTLPNGYLQVFNLYAIEGYSHREIAEMLGVSVNTSKTQLLKARRLLQKKLTDLDINDSQQ